MSRVSLPIIRTIMADTDDTREHTTESIESTFISCWNYLGDVHHQWTVWITIGNGNAHSSSIGPSYKLQHDTFVQQLEMGDVKQPFQEWRHQLARRNS
ncbi:hypothetical protein CYY_008588 [Polysphondylium violaceum]|uniref:Uncharacterized protein n=1 Tax=Polysphondylium violaceum TaxID=133409 RepID=A0A8J4UX66_9MYCE|nr:hypothetical protein CYY_008588 [Polysphondylium violaceum]